MTLASFRCVSLLLCILSGTLAEVFTDADYEAYNYAIGLEDKWINGTFPAGFMWSSATSAYQIEGGWNASGKGESIWDRKVHTGGIESDHTGDIACNSYYDYEKDIAQLVELGVSHYRFSIAWTRIQPLGEEDTPNAEGIAYYNKIIDGLIAAKIEPVVTLYHWDLPQALQDQGGWLNESLIVPAFVKYSEICFNAFGDRVTKWITLNEPWIIALLGYGNGAFAPGVKEIGTGVYVASRNLILAHAAAYHAYDNDYRPTQKGEIGITLNTGWSEAKNRSSEADIEASMRQLEFEFGWFANPVFGNGDFPEVMKSKVAEKSQQHGLNETRLPVFSEEEKLSNKGTSDFFGLNFYTSVLIFDKSLPDEPNYDNDKDTGAMADESWPTTGSDWLRMTPFGMRKILAYIDRKYQSPRILITENGVSDRNDSIADTHRIRYYRTYINNVLQAINIDKCKVIGYTAWSLMDNFEWNTGYNENFGLYHVDFEDPARPRKPKDSAKWFKQLVKDNGWPVPEPSGAGSITPGVYCGVLALVIFRLVMF